MIADLLCKEVIRKVGNFVWEETRLPPNVIDIVFGEKKGGYTYEDDLATISWIAARLFNLFL